MATPLPTDGDMDRFVPHGEETALTVRGLASAPRPTNGPTGLQTALFRAIVDAKSGLDVDVHAHEPVEPDVFGGALARRDRMLRPRLVHHMEPLDLVLQPLDQTAARRVETFFPPTSPETTAAGQRPAQASRRHEPRPAGRGKERGVPTGTMSPRAMGPDVMTAKPCDPTATAPEEGR